MATRLPKPPDPRTLQAQRLFGQQLAKLRTKAGRSQEARGAVIGTDGNRISRFERGLISPTLGTIVALADALEVEPKLLLAWPKDR